jgi:serine/threonine-protein kinase RsbW
VNEKPHQLGMTIDSDPALLVEVRKLVELFFRDHGFDEDGISSIGLCVNEALANVMRHAYKSRTDQPIRIDAEVVDDEARILIRDWGSGVDPTHLKPPTAEKDPMRPGGLGLQCIREMMDEVTFLKQSDGMLLKLTRKRSCEPKNSAAS